MANFKRSQLFRKLDQTAYQSMESATILCKTRGNPYVELIHWINQILMGENSDFHAAVRFFALDEAALAKDLLAALDRLPRGAGAINDFSASIQLAVKEAWMVSTMIFNDGLIRTGHLLIALKQTPELARVLHDMSEQFVRVNGDLLAEKFSEITKDSPESSASAAPASAATGQAEKLMTAPSMGGREALGLYTVDMTAAAKTGKYDAVTGRDTEIRKCIDILLRRRQNNPILTGEAGVGKTAVVEGFAARLAANDVPDCLKNTTLRSLDLGLLQAGASMKGEFENRLKQVIDEVRNAEQPTILFIDEAHTLVGAGGAAGQNDAANLLKPALARGELRCIAATTWKEYVKYFEKDPALARRFQNILVDEPADGPAVGMLRAMSASLEKHHRVHILDEALEAAVKLSRRYIPARQLPDKAVSVLDTACARVALSLSGEPAELEYCRRGIEALTLELEILGREEKLGADHTEKRAATEEKLKRENARRAKLEKQFEAEKKAVSDYLEARDKLEAAGKEDAALKKKVVAARKKLESVQGESPMLQPDVDAQAVSTIISEWTGIPLGRMVRNEIASVLNLGSELKKRVIGQDQGLDLIARRVTTARANLADPNRPIAVIMLAGPSGVGKTETALALAEQMYGSENNIVTVNMSEFQEAHTVSTLKGAPPGYVGYGEGGVLTEAVRRKPYSVVLLDEIEKAHPDVHEIFFQVFDKGQMEDGEGRKINFRNTVIILTTNVGDDAIMELCSDEAHLPPPETLETAVRPAMLKKFPAALLGRLSVVPYYPLGKQALYRIIDLKLGKIVRRVRENYRAEMEYTDAVRDELIRRCDNVASGARMIDAIVNNDLLPEISAKFLENTMEGKSFVRVGLDAADGRFIYRFKLKDN